MSNKINYTPPFVVSADTINLIAEISAQIERYAIRLEQADGLRLRKANRIKTIHSSLAIEGNRLSHGQVEDIINGKNVVAPIKEIMEVKNAISTYEMFKSLNPFSMKDLLKAHGVMMKSLVDNPGHFRTGNVGVFEQDRCIHLAPPPHLVHGLMTDLFSWLKNAKDHLLIRSCVFHYEFEFIHPFADGNGRMGRLWQSLILGNLHPLFEYLPIENMVYAKQEEYYDAITLSTANNECSPFIMFMLKEILNALKTHQGEPTEENGAKDGAKDGVKELTERQSIIIKHIKNNSSISAKELSQITGIAYRTIQRDMALLQSRGIIKREGGRRLGYWKTNI